MDNKEYTYENKQESKFTLHLILSIIQICFCCTITGVIALIFTIQASTMRNANNITTALKYERYTKTALTIGFTIFAAVIALSILWFCLVLGAAGGMTLLH